MGTKVGEASVLRVTKLLIKSRILATMDLADKSLHLHFLVPDEERGSGILEPQLSPEGLGAGCILSICSIPPEHLGFDATFQ